MKVAGGGRNARERKRPCNEVLSLKVVVAFMTKESPFVDKRHCFAIQKIKGMGKMEHRTMRVKNMLDSVLHVLIMVFCSYCFCCCNGEFVAQKNEMSEVGILMALKSGIVDSSGRLSDWTEKNTSESGIASHCSWSGVSCDAYIGKVTSLNLSCMNLTGSISSEIQGLVHLQVLNISHNMFGGVLPLVLFNLTRLRRLDINHNSFEGPFPEGISRLKNLVSFVAFSNSFTGPLPVEFIELPFLEQLDLGGSYFNGSVPPQYGSFRNLRYLHLAGNALTGAIPPELGMLRELRHLEIGYNNFSGGIPWQLGNMTELEYLDIAQGNLSGGLPWELGRLRKLNTMYLFRNSLVGIIPGYFGNLRSLASLDLSNNMISGSIPRNFWRLKKLSLLCLMYNNMSGSVPRGIGELPKLEVLRIWSNSFTGMLPQELGNKCRLKELDVSSNRFTGPIPPFLCAGGELFKLIMFSNRFSGEIPAGLATCSRLWRFRVADNMLSGRIPPGLGLLHNLTFVDLSMNNFSMGLAPDIFNAPRLQFINVSYNSHLGGKLPDKVWSTPSLQIFSASFSNISGKIPSFKDCNFLYKLELQGNILSGSIPRDITHCQKLLNFKVSDNRLTGPIMPELAMLPEINEIDLSHNAFTGVIPQGFDNCTTLEIFNVSFNRLTGPVPSDGPVFRNISSSVFAGNPGLCGGVLVPCLEFPTPDLYSPRAKKPGPLVWVMGGVFALALFILIVGTRCFYKHYKGYILGNRYRTEHDEGPWKMTAFQRLNFTVEAILECLKASNIIGMGSAGTVYKAQMPNGETIAVKKLWTNPKEAHRRRRGVLAEVDVLGNVRHRNIVRLLGCCSNNETTLLLYEYMPNGSLADLLHGNKEANMLADWMTRYKVAVGVAQGLMYLHHDCYPVVVHRDVKPSNILLDADMEARVADFGVAKLIQSDESMSVIAGSYGYIAPEYAYTLQVDEKSDIYSFGVVLLEILTGRRSVDSEFGDAINIVDWVRAKIQTKEGILEVLDKNVGASCSSVQEEMMLVLRVALLCTARCPADRPSMRDVVSMLSEAKPRRKSLLNLHCLQQQQNHLLRSSSSKSNPSSQESSPAASRIVV